MRTCNECGIEIRKENRSGFCFKHSLAAREGLKHNGKVMRDEQARVDRDPRICCGVRGDVHHTHGCGR